LSSFTPPPCYSIEGERLLPTTDGPGLVITTQRERPDWISRARVDEDPAGFEGIGVVLALRYADALWQLRRVESVGVGTWRYVFVPWPSDEMPRRVVVYPKDDIARLKREAFERRQHLPGISFARYSLIRFVGWMPGDWQHALGDWWELDLRGASKINAYTFFAIGLVLCILFYIVGGFAMAMGAGMLFEQSVGLLAPYLWLDGMFRLIKFSESFNAQGDHDEEYGMFVLELPWRAFLWWRERSNSPRDDG